MMMDADDDDDGGGDDNDNDAHGDADRDDDDDDAEGHWGLGPNSGCAEGGRAKPCQTSVLAKRASAHCSKQGNNK